MDAEVTSLLAYRMRRLVTEYGDSAQLTEAVRQLLQGQRNAQNASSACSGMDGAEPLFGHRLQVLGNE